ncbi:MAG: hypothetical protein AAFX50_18770 [Acidobacteriota bacterium]
MRLEKRNHGFIYRRGVGATLVVIPAAVLFLGAAFGAMAYVADWPWAGLAAALLFTGLSVRVAIFFARQDKRYLSLDAGSGYVEAGVLRGGRTHPLWRRPVAAVRSVSVMVRDGNLFGSSTLVAVIDDDVGQPHAWDLLPWTSELPGTLRKMAAAFADAHVPTVEVGELAGQWLRLIPVYEGAPADEVSLPEPVGRIAAPRPRGWNPDSAALALLGLVMVLPGAAVFAMGMFDLDPGPEIKTWLFTEARRDGDLVFTFSAVYLLAMVLMAAGLLVLALAALRAKDRGFRQLVLPALVVSAMMIFMLPTPSDRVVVTAESISQELPAGPAELRFDDVDRVVRWFEGKSVMWTLYGGGERREDLRLSDLWELVEARLIEVVESRGLAFEDFGSREPFDLGAGDGGGPGERGRRD